MSFASQKMKDPLRGPQCILTLGVWMVSIFLESLQGFCATPWKWDFVITHIGSLRGVSSLLLPSHGSSGLCSKYFTCWASLQPVWLHLDTLILMVWKVRKRGNFQKVFLWYIWCPKRWRKVSLTFLELASKELSSQLSSPIAHLCGIRKSLKETSSSQGSSRVRLSDQHTLFLLTAS
jgi:hypothetical protein